MIVLVFGGRDFSDKRAVHKAFAEFTNHVGPISQVIHGKARGADRLGGIVAAELGILVREFPADWDGLGKRAGPIRNQQMLDDGKPDAAIGFPGGRGTADMVERLRKIKLPLWDAGALDAYK